MNYKRIYDLLIKSRTHLNRKKYNGEYFEKHHIIPKCHNGTNDKSNLILLTAREHYIAHWLLSKIYTEDNKMCYALWMLSHDNQNNYIKYNSKKYQNIKKNYAIHQSIISKHRYPNGPFYKKHHTNKSKDKIGISVSGKNNGNYEINPWDHSSVIHNKDLIQFYKKIHIVYSIWILSDNSKYKLLQKLCYKNDIISSDTHYQRTFQNLIKWFITHGNPLDNNDWLKWNNNNNNNILNIPEDMIIFKYNPWDHGLVKHNKDLMKMWSIADELYLLWLRHDKMVYRKFSKLCYTDNYTDKKIHMGGLLKWFNDNNDPILNKSWIYKFR